MRWLAPSRAYNPWVGRPIKDSKWTVQQVATMARERPEVSLDGPAEFHLVECRLDATSLWSRPETVYIPCPVVTRSWQGKALKIVRPDGSLWWVRP